MRQKCEEVNTRPGNQTALVCSLFGWTQATKHTHLARVQPGRAEPGSLLGAWLRWAANQTRPKPLFEGMSSQAPTTMPGNRTGSSKDEVYFNLNESTATASNRNSRYEAVNLLCRWFAGQERDGEGKCGQRRREQMRSTGGGTVPLFTSGKRSKAGWLAIITVCTPRFGRGQAS